MQFSRQFDVSHKIKVKMEGSIDAKTIFDLALVHGSLADKDGWEKAVGQVLLEATISFIKKCQKFLKLVQQRVQFFITGNF